MFGVCANVRLSHMHSQHGLAYSDSGSGEPIVFIHGGLVRDAFTPVLAQPVIGGYRRISYHRPGWGASRGLAAPATISGQVELCLALLRQLGVERAHVAGYSMGGAIALQMALDAPDAVQSLMLFEPLVPAALTAPETVQYFVEAAGQAFGRYAAGEVEPAIDGFAQAAFGPAYREILDTALPGASERMTEDADVQFQFELPGIQQWQFGPAEAARVGVPVLSLHHKDARWDGFRQTAESLSAWLPRVQTEILPATSHLLQVEAPRQAAVALGRFVKSHPMVMTAVSPS
jgi:pimeloyl-ACP methyl ester carboxylesterase